MDLRNAGGLIQTSRRIGFGCGELLTGHRAAARLGHCRFTCAVRTHPSKMRIAVGVPVCREVSHFWDTSRRFPWRDRLKGTMHYPRILALIDAELDRLHRARLLLASSLGSSGKVKREKTSSGGPPAIREFTKAKQITASPKETVSRQEPVLQTDAIARKQTRQVPRRNRPATRTPIAAPFVSPLAGVIPSGPVFVSARQVHELHSARQVTQTLEHSDPHATNNLTAELVRQKWLHSSTS